VDEKGALFEVVDMIVPLVVVSKSTYLHVIPNSHLNSCSRFIYKNSDRMVIKHFVLFLTDNPGAFASLSNIIWRGVLSRSHRVLLFYSSFLLLFFFSHFSCVWIS